MKTVYFVRHGSTPLLESSSYQDHGTPLSEQGIRQAQTVSKRFASIFVDRIFSSTMERAAQTARAIAEPKSQEVEQLPIFNEILRPSAIRGKPRDDSEVARIFAEVTGYFGDANRRHSDEENFYDLKARANEAIGFLESRTEERILVVTHGVFLKMILAAMMFGSELTSREFHGVDKFLYPRNTGITKCTLKEERWRLMTWNDDEHLGELID